MKKLIALLLVLVMVAGLVACAGSNDETKGNDTTNTENTADSNGDSNTGSGEPIYIGLSAKITGADAANGDRMVKAAQMAVDEVNAAGGLLGGAPGGEQAEHAAARGLGQGHRQRHGR